MTSTTGAVLRTPRLVLTPVRAADVEPLLGHWNDAEVGRYLWDGVPVLAETVRDVVASSERDFSRAGFGVWAVRRTTAGALIGTCGLRATDDEVELLFSLDPAYRGRGLATEAARVVLDHAVRLDPVVAFTDAGNVASQRVLARLGMTPCDFTTTPWVRWQLGRTT